MKGSRLLRLSFAMPWITVSGFAALFISRTAGFWALYAGVVIGFAIVSITLMRAMVSVGERSSVLWIIVAFATFAGDVLSTLVASGLDYQTFAEHEANAIVVISVDPRHLVLSGIALMSIKLCAHLWTFAFPTSWVAMQEQSELDYTAMSRLTYVKYFRYTRFTFMSESWRALMGGTVVDRIELQMMMFIWSKFSSYIWAAVFIIVTTSNFLGLAAATTGYPALLIAHRVAFVSVVVLILAEDTIGFFACRAHLRRVCQPEATGIRHKSHLVG